MTFFPYKDKIAQETWVVFNPKMHMLENGTWANAIDEYHWIAKNATMECMKWFMHAVIVIFQSRYL
jgi:hypothetical protein